MSEQETIKGKLKKIFSGTEEKMEEFTKELCEKNGYIFDERYHRTYVECLDEEGYGKHIIINSDIYEVIGTADIIIEDVFEASKNPDGTISFFVSYYNGGCSFGGAIEEALKNMEED